MENQLKEHDSYIIKDDFPDEFQCCICLDLLYKPVVVACGHLACFWCIYNSMSFLKDSRCPVCRHPYNHFPRICRLMLLIIRKSYPSAYARREKQVIKHEQKSGNVSQPFDDLKSDYVSCELPSDLSEVVRTEDRDSTMTTKLSSETAEDVLIQQNVQTSFRLLDGPYLEVVMSDLTCTVCKQLLCRPVALNCGDVYCEACIVNLNDTICKCPVCQIPQPCGLPNICWVLEHFLEEKFPDEYAARRESLLDENKDHGRSLRGDAYSASLPVQGQQTHIAGCDYCGMQPIVGKRYRCKDCKEKMGFDLCEGCYNSSCKLPGRFNQQHTEDHQFEIIGARRTYYIS